MRSNAPSNKWHELVILWCNFMQKSTCLRLQRVKMITKWNHPLDPLWPPRNPKTELFNLNLKKVQKGINLVVKTPIFQLLSKQCLLDRHDLIFLYSEIGHSYSEKVKNIYRKYSKTNDDQSKLILMAVLFSGPTFHDTRKIVGFWAQVRSE